MALDSGPLRTFVDATWNDSIVSTLEEYIRIPNKSPDFDPNWRESGHMDRAVALIFAWLKKHAPKDATLEVVTLDERTPVIVVEIPGTVDDTVLLYGHLDKQPEMTGWDDDLGPWKPVLRDDKLYGRGGADDGYAAFASLTAINGLRKQKAAHPRCVILIEACEESGSADLPYYIDHLADRIGKPSLVVCLDSGCGNYDQMWCTTSLRGIITANLNVELISEGVHSGDASGVVADSFRVVRALLSRLEDESTGDIIPEGFYVAIPDERVEQARRVAKEIGPALYDKFPFVEGVQPMSDDGTELILNRTWRPALTITGADGLPSIANAGNVTRPLTAVKLSLRLPPTLPAAKTCDILKDVLTKEPPHGARVTLEHLEGQSGWDAPPVANWLMESMQAASRAHFNADPMFMGEGGSIPFMGMLGEKFPEAQFLITGVLGPKSNAHGPNEFLHLPTARKLTACVADIIADRARVVGK